MQEFLVGHLLGWILLTGTVSIANKLTNSNETTGGFVFVKFSAWCFESEVEHIEILRTEAHNQEKLPKRLNVPTPTLVSHQGPLQDPL